MENLLKNFAGIGGLSPADVERLLSVIQKLELSPRTVLLDAGQICDTIYFIEQGSARTFYFKGGKDITYWIAMENDFVGSMSSFFTRKPSNKSVETVEQSIVWAFQHDNLEQLFSSSQEMERMGRLFANHGLAMMEERFDNLHCNTAKERYDLLMEKQAQIIQRIPLGMIASYLGITQETLSRIRSAK